MTVVRIVENEVRWLYALKLKNTPNFSLSNGGVGLVDLMNLHLPVYIVISDLVKVETIWHKNTQ